MKIAFVYDEIPNNEIISHFVHGKHLEGLCAGGNICRGFSLSYDKAVEGAFEFIDDPDRLCREISEFSPDFVYIEGADVKNASAILNAGFNCCIRVNGDEPMFRKSIELNALAKSANPITDFLDMRKFKRAVKEAAGIVGFIFASKRVKQEFAKLIDIQNFPGAVIPRPIDVNVFDGIERPEGTRKNCLILERFNRGKAGRACVNAIFSLRFVPEFSTSRIVFAGEGKRFLDETRPLKTYHNISVINRIPDGRGIRKLMATNGVLLHPVSIIAQSIMLTCAMASGMVVVTLDRGMSELINHGKTGYIANNPIELGACIESIWNDPLNFVLVSKKAKEAVQTKCSIKAVCYDENEFMKWISRNLNK